MYTKLKYAQDILDYVIDFSPSLPETDQIQSVLVEAVGPASVSSYTIDGKRVIVWVSGGAEGEVTTIFVTADTVEGRRLRRGFRVLTAVM